MQSKKDKIIVAVTGVALTIVFLVALVIGDASGLKVDEPSTTTKAQVADSNEDETSSVLEGESSTTTVDSSEGNTDTGETSSEGEDSGEEQTTPPADKPDEPEMFLVNLSDFVYVRAEASKEGEILGKVYAGGGGEVIEAGTEWTKIKSGELEGYVFSEYIWTGEEAEKNLSTVGKKIGTITTDDLRIRDAASTSSDVLGYYDTGAEVEIVTVGDEWHEIKYDGDEAYISADYVTIRYEYSLGVTVAEEQAAIKAEEERLVAAAAAAAAKEKEREDILDAAVAGFDFSSVVRATAYTNISNEDIYLMMCVVSKECGHDVYEGQLAVANLILNRYCGQGYGDTVRDVLFAKNQFSVVTWDSFWEVVKEGPLQSSVNAVIDAIGGNNNVPRYTNYRSLTGIDDEDYAIMNEYSVIGNQVFYNRK